MFTENLIRIWKSRNQILEGVTNSIFKREDVEFIAEERMKVCRKCPSGCYDASGEGCMIPGTAPCCNQNKGGCGCSLSLKTRALSDKCPFGHWMEELTEDEYYAIKEKLAF